MIVTPHPVYPSPEVLAKFPDHQLLVQIGVKQVMMTSDKLAEFITQRELTIQKSQTDPLRYGYEPPIWKKADEERTKLRAKYPVGVIYEWNMGGNRASKSERAAKRIVQLMLNKPNAEVWCLTSTEQHSRGTQQRFIYKYLPPELKNETGKLRRGITTKIVYNITGGFSENVFALPNGSKCIFKFYSMDVGGVEGAELDSVWADELITPDWIEAIRHRLTTRNGIFHITFTPVEGWTATVAMALANAKTLEDEEAELLPSAIGGFERVPRVQQLTNPRAICIYFHTKDNPFGNYESVKMELEGGPRDKIKERMYGVATKACTARFPKFREKVHVVAAEMIPKEGTRYHVVDPCSGRNWFMIWALVDVRSRIFVYREWPCVSRYIEGVGFPDPWAIPSRKADGDRGDAQKSFGWGLQRYKQEIDRCEGEGGANPEIIFERIMDSRYANSSTMGREIQRTVLEECEEVGLDFIPAPGEHISEGVDLINNLLDWDDGKPIDATNEPKLFVSAECSNVIYSLKEWTGADGKEGASKDPIDVLRYLVLSDVRYLENGCLLPKPGGYY